jgi:hypothetical protein
MAPYVRVELGYLGKRPARPSTIEIAAYEQQVR